MSFCKLKQIIRNIYNRICEETAQANVTEIITELTDTIEEFDKNWVNFEQVRCLVD